MARRPRLAAQAAAASMRNRIPNLSDNEDEDMVDAPATDAPTPQEDEDENVQEDEEDEQNDAEDDATPSQASPQPSRSATPRRGRGTSSFPRRRRLGRPPKRPILGSDDEANDAASDTGTPRRRGSGTRGRGSRWGKSRGGLSRQSFAPVDEDGNLMEIVDDEVELPDIPEGEKKVDKNGYLQDDREYRVRTFTIAGRGNRLYMLSTEPARCIGFRDSYLFFQKHRNLYKIIIDDDEKRDLIERDLMPHSYKGRAIGVVTARSVFREFGSKIVIGGKKITDDYDEQAARDRGDLEGELAVPDDRLPAPGEPYNRNQYVAWHGASAVYHTNAPTVPLPIGKVPESKRKRIIVTSDNWKFEHAQQASHFNSLLSAARKENSKGVYDIHTNIMHWPGHMQPTHARWEPIQDEMFDEEIPSGQNTALPRLNPVYARNFRIHDLCLESAPESCLGAPGDAENQHNLSNLPTYILEELPLDCLEALQHAQERESAWRQKWRSESIDGYRTRFLPSVEWYPK